MCRRDVGPKVLIHSFARATVETSDVEGLSDAEVKLGVFIFPVRGSEDFWALDVGVAKFFVLSEAGMRPFLVFGSLSVFAVSDSETAFCFSDVVCFVRRAVVLVYTAIVHAVRSRFI